MQGGARVLTTKPILEIPSAYRAGYEKARLEDQAAADNYVRHTIIGDPQLDPVMEEIADLSPPALHRFIHAGIEQQQDQLKRAPKVMRDFFEEIEQPPVWFDYKACDAGIRAFYANANFVLVAFVAGVLIEGFSSLIATSFNITSRTVTGPGDRRLRQNNRQLMEIFVPGGLHRYGDGWKLSVRVRLVHARIRSLLAKAEPWDAQAWGTPLSAAHLGYAICVFSIRLVEQAISVGAKFARDEVASFLALWRYVGHLMGIPDSILYADEAQARHLIRITLMCEPPPGRHSVEMAQAFVHNVPTVAGIEDPREADSVRGLVFRLSRALIGNELADALQFPRSNRLGTLYFFRMKQIITRMLKGTRSAHLADFLQLLDVSQYDDEGMSYVMPDHWHTSKQNPW